MKKTKILHLISGLEIGGAETMLLQVLPLLNDFEHVVCSLSGPGVLGEKIESLGFKLICLENGKRFSLRSIILFKKIIKQEKPNIISTRLIHADIFGRIFGKLFGVKNIVCILESILDNQKYNKFFLIEKFSSFLVDQYIAVSNAVKNKYVTVAKIKPEKITVIHNGIDLKKFQLKEKKEAVRKKLGLPVDDVIIGYAAKMRPERNHSALIESIGLLKKYYPNIRLVLAGNGPEKDNLVKLVKELKIDDNVIFLGQRNDIPEILNSLDIFVSPSQYEGMSIAILEAMGAGLPIIASDIEPNRELIENDKDGILIDQNKPKSIAEKIQLLIEDIETRKNLINSVKNKIKLFSLEKTVSGLNGTYKQF